MFSRKPLATAFAAALSVLSAPSFAYDERPVYSPDGTEVMRLRFYGLGDGTYMEPRPGEPNVSTWNLSERQKRSILAAASYWAEVIRPKPGGEPAIVNIGTTDAVNAFGTAVMASNDGRLLYTGMQVVLQGEVLPAELLNRGSHGQFVMGKLPYADEEYLPSQNGLAPRLEMTSVAVHELAHSLGLMNIAGDRDGKATPYFGEVLDVWATHLVDDNGNPARPNQAILCADCNNPYDPDAFDNRGDRALFVGEHVRDALEGGLPGVPVRMMADLIDGAVDVDDNYMSHIELRNSLMSHQSYRNYTSFMEAELAIVQDLGYDVDRRNFFGRSIYGSGLGIVNERGFYARNAEGTDYLVGQYNTASMGVGLHVYGSDNDVRQAADLLSAGAGGAGIRVDGVGNAVTVDPGVRVHAQGLNGSGILFAYGKGHRLVQRGEVRATGDMGVGLRFDFGNNQMGNSQEYRGSYIHSSDVAMPARLAELDGALMERVDITGTVAGSAAALYMSPSALVGQVNVMQGARIDGDIVSDYAQRDGNGALRLTTLSFGQAADGEGRATGAADDAFAMHYAGTIRGRDNLHVSLDGGVTMLEGRHELHGLTVRQGATLAGNGRFAISPEGGFVNRGTVAPGEGGADVGRVEIAGNYVQDGAGRLAVDVTPAGAHDVLAVQGSARLDGTLAVQASPGWYASGWTRDARLVEASATEGDFSAMQAQAASPTLRFGASSLTSGVYRLSATRAEDAYSRHAADDNGRRAGMGLQRAAGQLGADPSAAGAAAGAFGAFVTALDFSALDGSEVRSALGQVSPAPYSAGLSASLHREREVMDLALQGVRAPADDPAGEPGAGRPAAGEPAAGRPAAGSWQGFAAAFGGKADQHAHGSALGYDASTYGLVIGARQRLAGNPAVTVGGHLDIAHQSYTLDAPVSGKGRTTAFGLGLLAGYAREADAGMHAWGGLRAGIENASLERSIAVAGYRAAHSADWTGHSASASVGAGYRWRLAPGVSAGPVASLSYARVSRPGVEEDGEAATRLKLKRERFDALRSSLGVAAQSDRKLESGALVTAHVQATWDREWLGRHAVQGAAFAAVPTASFTSRNAVLPRDSLGLQAGLSYRPNARMTVGAALNGRVGGGYRAVSGELRMRWAF